VNPINGVKVATVSEVADPLAIGRVLVRLSDTVSETQVWARVVGSLRGSVAQLGISDEVLVAFAGGDPRSPVVIGRLWQGDSAPPTQAGTNTVHRPLRPPFVRVLRPR